MTTPTGNPACSHVDCTAPLCLPQCGIVQWFNNFSTCTVALEFALPGTSTWSALGPFAPGARLQLGTGALYFPRATRLQVVESSTGRVIKDFGQLGAGRRALYVDTGDCAEASPSPASTPGAVANGGGGGGGRSSALPLVVVGAAAVAVLLLVALAAGRVAAGVLGAAAVGAAALLLLAHAT